MGSIPVRVTNKKQLSKEGCFFFYLLFRILKKTEKSIEKGVDKSLSMLYNLSCSQRAKSVAARK
ncbi:MAG: hypothetical protein IJC44_07075, partial [Clostridia bacterium]|nr:hypothetical protein [Clostridia bacterium]